MAYSRSLSILVLLFVGTITGCQQPEGSGTANDSPPTDMLFAFEGYPLHAAVRANPGEGRLVIKTLGPDAATIQPIEAQQIKLAMKHGNHIDKFTFKAIQQAGEPANLSSTFEANSRHLAKALAGKAGRSAKLMLTLGGKELVGRPEATHHEGHDHDHHGHDHHDHGHDDHDHHGHDHDDATANVLVWHDEFEFQGKRIRLGQHGLVVESGAEFEPAVSIEQNGQPVKDAKVSVSLLTADGKQALAESQSTHFEPASEEEPPHFAQAFLAVPEDAKQVNIRYRIDWTDGTTTTRDVLVQTESHAH